MAIANSRSINHNSHLERDVSLLRVDPQQQSHHPTSLSLRNKKKKKKKIQTPSKKFNQQTKRPNLPRATMATTAHNNISAITIIFL
jgi:hypothetical protein